MAKKKLVPEYNFSLGKESQAASTTIKNIFDSIDNSEKSFYKRLTDLRLNQSNNTITFNDIARNFIRKNIDDFVSGELTMSKGVKSSNYRSGIGGVGYRLYHDENGKGILDIDNVNVREALFTTILTYNKVNATGGSIVVSAAWANIVRSELSGAGESRKVRCYFKPEGFAEQPWRIHDQVRMQRGLDKMLYTLVTGLSYNPDADGNFWIDLYMGDNDFLKIGDSIPVAGDTIVQWGSRAASNYNRKNIIIMSVGDNASDYPYIEQYTNVDGFSLENKLMTRISSDVYFGAPDKSKYIWWNKDNNSEFLIKGTLTQSPSGDTAPLPVWRGEWEIDTEYFSGDLVSFNGSTYIANQDNYYTSPYSAEYWDLYTEKGADGSNGKMLSISGSSQVFKIDKFSVISPQYISISAIGSNLSGTPSFSVSSGTATLTNNTTYSKYLLFSNMSSENATIKVDWDGFTDYYTVYKVREGSDAITVVLSNQQGHISCDSNWNVLDLSGTATYISVYYGAEQLEFDDNYLGGGFPSSNGKWRFTYIEAPSIEFDSYYVVDSYTVLIEPWQELVQQVNSTWRDYTIRARANNTNHEITVRQNIAVIRNGAKGDTGSVGQSIRYSNWKLGNVYFAGNLNDGGTNNNPNRYLDYVTHEVAGVVRAYKCNSYHTANSSNYPSYSPSTTYWEQVSYFPVIASDLILANQAVIGGFAFSSAVDAYGDAIPASQQEIRTTDSPTNPAIRLKGDGSGHLAKGNIAWDESGNVQVVGSAELANGRLIANVDGTLSLEFVTDAGGSTRKMSISSTTGIIESRIEGVDSSVARISTDGVFANRASENPLPPSAGVDAAASVVGLGWGAVSNTSNPNGFLAGVYGRATNSASNPAPAFGGYFQKLKANGLYAAVKSISDLTNKFPDDTTNIYNTDMLITCYNTTSVTLYLPPSPDTGHMLFFKLMNATNVTISGNGNNLFSNTSLTSYSTSVKGQGITLFWDGGYWVLGLT